MAMDMLPRNTLTEEDAEGSQYTTTTDSTIPGPGALGGKAIKALGKFTIRGIDRVIISARLRSITSKFPHSNEQAPGIKGIQEMYNVILELCRLGMYNDELRNKALQLLVVQIRQGQIQALISALSRWHLIEVELLLPEIVDRIIPIRRQPWGRDRLPRVIQEHVLPDLTIVSRAPESSAPLKRTIREAAAQDKAFCTAYKQSFAPLLAFLSCVAEINTGTCKAVLQAGYLDILLVAQKQISGIENIVDLFKVFLCQPRLLTPIIREKVLNLIVNEILENRIEHVVAALAKWSIDDVRVLITELEGNTAFNRALSKYSGTPSPFEQNVAFLFRIAGIGKTYLHAVVNAGFLNILQTAYEQQFSLEDNEFFSVVFEVLRANAGLKVYRSKAVDLLVESILRRKTTHILSTLGKWDIKDLEDIIMAVFQRAGPVGFGAEGPFGPKRNVFHSRDGIYHFDQDRVVSVMTFVGKVARLSEEAFQAVIRAGILDALLVIQSHDLSVHGLDEKFNIILEVLRPGSFANKVRKQALDLLVFQVCRGEARYMLKIISKWSNAELNRVIWEISAQFPPMSNRRALEDLFTRPQETQTLSTLYLQRLLSFLAGIAQSSEAAGQVVLQTGFMDVLLALQKDESHKIDVEGIDELILGILQKSQLHDEKTKKKALSYISAQTESKETHIYKVIGNRSISELERLISGMLEHFHFGGLIPGPTRRGAIKPNDLASLGTCVLIFSKVIQKHRFAFQALINAGILDVLLAIQDRQHSIDSLKNIYDIVLTALYMDSVSDKALKIISYQISHESTCLLRALRKYSDQEFKIVAPAILQGLRHSLSVHEGHTSPCPGPHKPSLANSIAFLCELSFSNRSAFQYIWDADFINMFLGIDHGGLPGDTLVNIYTLLLEYARPNAYDSCACSLVLDFFAEKMEKERLPLFTKALEKVDVLILEEVVSDLLFRSQILWCECPPSSMAGRKLGDRLVSCVQLMSAVCRINSAACRAVLERGFLDALFYISETAAKVSIQDSRKSTNVDKAVIRRVIDSFLLDVIAYPEHRDVVFLHPIYPSFPTVQDSDPIQTYMPSLADWHSHIDFALFISTIKGSQHLQYLYFTVLPCVAVCWSFIWVIHLFLTERPFVFDRIADLGHVR